MSKGTSVIPKGYYCYDEKGVCPYWSIRKDKPEQMNGFCSFIKKGDWELGPRAHPEIRWTRGGKPMSEEVSRKLSETIGGILWDQCKECGIKED